MLLHFWCIKLLHVRIQENIIFSAKMQKMSLWSWVLWEDFNTVWARYWHYLREENFVIVHSGIMKTMHNSRLKAMVAVNNDELEAWVMKSREMHDYYFKHPWCASEVAGSAHLWDLSYLISHQWWLNLNYQSCGFTMQYTISLSVWHGYKQGETSMPLSALSPSRWYG